MGHKESYCPLPGLPNGAVPADHGPSHFGDVEATHAPGCGDFADPAVSWESAWIDLGGEG